VWSRWEIRMCEKKRKSFGAWEISCVQAVSPTVWPRRSSAKKSFRPNLDCHLTRPFPRTLKHPNVDALKTMEIIFFRTYPSSQSQQLLHAAKGPYETSRWRFIGDAKGKKCIIHSFYTIYASKNKNGFYVNPHSVFRTFLRHLSRHISALF